MKKQKISVIPLLCSVIMMLCSTFFGLRVLSYCDTMSIKYQESGLTSEQIETQNAKSRLASKNSSSLPYITGWDSIEDTMIQSSSFGRTQEITLLEIYGTMAAVFPSPLLHGSYLVKSDTKGCVISQITAEKLFQSSEVLGCLITLDKKQYCVKGVLTSKEPLMLIEKARSTPFPFLEFQYPNKQQPASKSKELLFQLGLPDYKSFLEGNFYSGIAYLLIGLPFLLFFGFLLLLLKNLLPKNSHLLWNSAKTIVINGSFLILLLLFAKYFIVFSEDLIPSRISDFSFWATKFKELRSDYHGILAYQTYYKEHWILWNLTCTFYTSLASILLNFVARWHLRLEGKKKPMI